MAGVVGIQPYLTNNTESSEQIFCRKLARRRGPLSPLALASADPACLMESSRLRRGRHCASQVNFPPVVFFVCMLAQLIGETAEQHMPMRSASETRSGSPPPGSLTLAPPARPHPAALLPRSIRSALVAPRLRAMGLEPASVDITVRGMRFSTVLNFAFMGKTGAPALCSTRTRCLSGV